MNANTESSASERPSRVRHGIVFVTFLAAFLLYLHRFCMTYAQRYVKEDLGLTDDHLGYCFSAFFFAYALGQVPSGWLSDRFGARKMLALYILTWSFFTALMGLTMGFVMLLAVRLAAGLGQAGAYPTSCGLLANWVPFRSRAWASSIVAFGGRFGGGLAPLLTVTMIVAFVPLSVPSDLGEDDLLDRAVLARAMTAANVSPTRQQTDSDVDAAKILLRRRVFGQMSGDVKEAFRAFPETDLINGEAFADQLLLDINSVIRGPQLIRETQTPIPLEREATQLLRQTELTQAQTERLNRLILEAVFPDSIRKIYVHGWRPVMFVYGAMGIVVALLFWGLFRNSPSAHPLCNKSEQALIETGRPARSQKEQGPARSENKQADVGRVPIEHILCSRSLWLMCVSQWGSNVGWVFLVTWLPRYLLEVHSAPLWQQGWMTALPLWAGWIGMLAGGRLSDAAVRRMGLRWGRLAPLTVGKFLAAGAYLLCLFHPSAWMITGIFAIVAFSTDMGSAGGWAYKQDVGGRHVASIHGWANMWGNLGATVSPVLLQVIIRNFGWDAAFLSCSIAFAIAGAAAIGVDASIPIVPDNTARDS
ncbi:MAG: MFS transporter [Planctomycetaceae bacterium]|nr:MFS transporter [Planctomycetaceae bacterium]MBT6154486.1 MFS transporter [Planctomycetaceae bacterium]MBT6486516.1 MFS transporter [Planctomycetaceae bacterium]MBT6497943.1 MFS transporter [Planctomycetaceae bacterium]